MSDVITALKRLERAGAEDSRTTAKLVAAARSMADYLATSVLPKDVREEYPAPYLTTRGDAWVWTGDALYCGHPEFEVATASSHWQRVEALTFAESIADGWLDRVADWMETRTQQASTATETLHRASAALRAGAEQSAETSSYVVVTEDRTRTLVKTSSLFAAIQEGERIAGHGGLVVEVWQQDHQVWGKTAGAEVRS